MNHYWFAWMVFKDGVVVNAGNRWFSQSKKASLQDFIHQVKHNHAGHPDNYDSIVITSWYSLPEEDYMAFIAGTNTAD